MPDLTPAAELRAAAGRLLDRSYYERTGEPDTNLAYDTAVAKWLGHDAVQHLPVSECRYCDPATNPGRVPCPGLAVARSINTPTEEHS